MRDLPMLQGGTNRLLHAFALLVFSFQAALAQIALQQGYGQYADLQVSLAPGDSYHLPLARVYQMDRAKNPRFTLSGSCGGKVLLSQLTTQLAVQRLAMPDQQTVELATSFGRYIAFYKFSGDLVQIFTFNPDPTEPKEFIADGPYNITLDGPLSCVTPVFLGGSANRIFMPCSDRLLIFKPTLGEVAGVVTFERPLTVDKDRRDYQVVVLPEQDILVGVSGQTLWHCSSLSANRLIDVVCSAQPLKWQYEGETPDPAWRLQSLAKVGSGVLLFWSAGKGQGFSFCKIDLEAATAKCALVELQYAGERMENPRFQVSRLETDDPAGGSPTGHMLLVTDTQEKQYLLGTFLEESLVIRFSTKVLGGAILEQPNRVFLSPQSQITAVGNDIADIRGRVHTGSIVVAGERAIQRAGNQIRLYTLEPEYLLISGLSSASEPESACNVTVSAFDDVSYTSVDVTVEVLLRNTSMGAQRSKPATYSLEVCPNSALMLQYLLMDGSNYFTPGAKSSDPSAVDVLPMKYESQVPLDLPSGVSQATRTLQLSPNLLVVFYAKEVKWYFCRGAETEIPRGKPIDCTLQLGNYFQTKPLPDYEAKLIANGRVILLESLGVACTITTGRCNNPRPEHLPFWGVGNVGKVSSAFFADGEEAVFRLVTGQNQISVWRVSYSVAVEVAFIGMIDRNSTMHGEFAPIDLCTDSVSPLSNATLAVWSKTSDPAQLLHLRFEFPKLESRMQISAKSEQLIFKTQTSDFKSCVGSTRFLMHTKSGLYLKDEKAGEILDSTKFDDDACRADESRAVIVPIWPAQENVAIITFCTAGTDPKLKLSIWGLATVGFSTTTRYLGYAIVDASPKSIVHKGAYFYLLGSNSISLTLLSTTPKISVFPLKKEVTEVPISVSLLPTKSSASVLVTNSTPEPIALENLPAQDYLLPEQEYSLSSRLFVPKGHVFSIKTTAAATEADIQTAQITRGVFTEVTDPSSQTQTLSISQYYKSQLISGDMPVDSAVVYARECVTSNDCIDANVYIMPGGGEYVLKVQKGQQVAQILLGKGDGAFRTLKLQILSDPKNIGVILQKETKTLFASVVFDATTQVEIVQYLDLQGASTYYEGSDTMVVGLSGLDSQTIQIYQLTRAPLQIKLVSSAKLPRPLPIITPSTINCQAGNGCVIWSLATRSVYSFYPGASLTDKSISEHLIPEGIVQKDSVVAGDCVVLFGQDTDLAKSPILVAYRKTSPHAIGVQQIKQGVESISTKNGEDQNKLFLSLPPKFSSEGKVTLETIIYKVQNDTYFNISKNKKSEDARLILPSLSVVVVGSPKLPSAEKVISLADLFKKAGQANPDTPKQSGSSALYWVVGIVSVVLAVVSSALVYINCRLKKAQEENLDGETNGQEALIMRKVPHGGSTFQNDSAYETQTDL